jgi:hypothetical protein
MRALCRTRQEERGIFFFFSHSIFFFIFFLRMFSFIFFLAAAASAAGRRGEGEHRRCHAPLPPRGTTFCVSIGPLYKKSK